MTPSIFAEKDFSRNLNDVNGYCHVFLDRIGERHWYDLVYDNSKSDAFCCSRSYQNFLHIHRHAHNWSCYQFTVHFDTRDLFVSINTIQEVTRIPNSPQHTEPLPLIDYMTIMSARCMEQDCGLKAITFRNAHCTGIWIQRNILGLDHTTSFNRPMLQIIYNLINLMLGNTRVVLQNLIANSQHIRGAKYPHPVLITRLCRNFPPDEIFSAFDRAS